MVVFMTILALAHFPHIQESASDPEDVFIVIDEKRPPTHGLRVASSGVSAKAIGMHLLTKYASEIGFVTTYHVSTTLDKQGRSRRVDISCVQGGKPRSTGKIANPSVSVNALLGLFQYFNMKYIHCI